MGVACACMCNIGGHFLIIVPSIFGLGIQDFLEDVRIESFGLKGFSNVEGFSEYYNPWFPWKGFHVHCAAGSAKYNNVILTLCMCICTREKKGCI